ncbi:hypothetical protein MBLNU230_g4781t1 [Neophaeotheca triangularis]
MPNPFNALPDIAPNGPLDNNKGPLSAIGDPVGQVLDKSLKPTVGLVTGGVGKPSGDAAMEVKDTAYEKAGLKEQAKRGEGQDAPGGERIGGNKQTGQNPLGL